MLAAQQKSIMSDFRSCICCLWFMCIYQHAVVTIQWPWKHRKSGMVDACRVRGMQEESCAPVSASGDMILEAGFEIIGANECHLLLLG